MTLCGKPLGGAVGRAVVDHNDTDARKILLLEVRETRAETPEAVVDRNHAENAGGMHL
jgi:hypothetical protein